MGKPDARRLDRAVQQTARKLEAVRNRELRPRAPPRARSHRVRRVQPAPG
ncbi:hypothetical protein GCM10010260_05680 [Streptomyces filipinensis]|uniref:Uncharacterized protein n=1 Tax=Streptomyces filipinensis TaxID=66887 RepID=A0A918I671_9ACTN|nr:hypothetical protein GCM10010260_05680 [Streptomyces filipinensis]